MNFVSIFPPGSDPFAVTQFQLVYATRDGVHG
jgi:hypothetical protein